MFNYTKGLRRTEKQPTKIRNPNTKIKMDIGLPCVEIKIYRGRSGFDKLVREKERKDKRERERKQLGSG